jgi:hypothetical protein
VSNVTTAVAVYGAVVASAAGGWNVYTYLRSNRTRVTIRANLEQFHPIAPPQGTNVSRGVCFQVRNRSSFPIKITKVGFGPKGAGTIEEFAPEGRGETLPLVVAPRDRVNFHWKTEISARSRVPSRIHGRNRFTVVLADGRKVWAPPFRLQMNEAIERAPRFKVLKVRNRQRK